MNFDYTQITSEQLLEKFKNKLKADDRFKNITTASLYQMYIETLLAASDMINFYIGRTAEEQFLETAKLDSSIIKLCKNKGYNPARPIPAKAEVAVRLVGPLPENIKAGQEIWFNNEQLVLTFGGNKFLLDACYSYKFTSEDVIQGKNPTWSKTIVFATDKNNSQYISLSDKGLNTIKVYQCELKKMIIDGYTNLDKIGKIYQSYDIDDLEFSNWYGTRDPFAISDSVYRPENGWCKIGIGTSEIDAFSKSKLLDIELENIFLNHKIDNETDNPTAPANVCRIESNADKTVKLSFGDRIRAINGLNSADESIYIQYVSTKGYSANKAGTKNSFLNINDRIYANGDGSIIDITANVNIIFTTDITSGENFESQISMKNNAALHFASRGQLISVEDFISYFRSLNNPINVKNAIAWKSLDDANDIGEKLDGVKNYIMYTVVSDLYESISDGMYAPKFLYNADIDSSVFKTTTLYGDYEDFNNNLPVLSNIAGDATEAAIECDIQYNDDSTIFYNNTNTIYNATKSRLMLGEKMIAIPPIIQYYDLIGKIEIGRKTNMDTYKRAIEGAIYSWLKENCYFNNKIYKNDIVKLIYDNDSTKRVNIDIIPSGLIRSQKLTYKFTDFSSSQNSNGQGTGYREFIISQTDDKGLNISTDDLLFKKVMISADDGPALSKKIISAEITVNNKIKFIFLGTGYVTQPTKLEILISQDDYDYESTVIDESDANDISVNMLTTSTTNATPIPLPYTADVSYKNTEYIERSLTYSRTGNINTSISGINERSFNLNYATTPGFDYNNTYPLWKFAIEDSILDDNNNIVNYSLPNEISVIRLVLTYTYGS